MALEDGDYGGAMGGFSDFLDPAMGRVLAENPEALINHFAAAGIPPPGPQFAENFAPRSDAAFPSQGVVGDQNIYGPAAAAKTATSEFPLVPGTEGVPSYQGTPSPGTPSLSQRIEAWGTRQVPQGTEASPTSPKRIPTESIKAPDRVAPSEPGPVPPEARGGPVADETTPGPTMVPYTVAPGAPGVSADVGGETNRTAALPSRDPRKPAPPEEAKADAAKLVSALAGVKAPPAPPQPVLRPFAGERPAAIPATSPIAALLASVLAGSPGAAQQLRLAQAVGGR